MRYDQLCRDRDEEHDPQSETAAWGSAEERERGKEGEREREGGSERVREVRREGGKREK